MAHVPFEKWVPEKDSIHFWTSFCDSCLKNLRDDQWIEVRLLRPLGGFPSRKSVLCLQCARKHNLQEVE